MPIYAYYDGGTGPLWINCDGWVTTATSTTSATTSSWYPFAGATTYVTPTLCTVTQGSYPASTLLYHDARWTAYANQTRQREAEYTPPASPAIIRERSEAETRRQAEINAQAREVLARQKAEQERINEARKRARELLLEHLTPEQRRMFEANNWFIVEGGKSKTKYRIQGNRVAGNIDVLDKDGVHSHWLCCHCDHTIPTHDHHLAQKYMLEYAEDDFLRIANRQ